MLKTIFLVLFLISFVKTAQILGIFLTPSISHQVVFRTIVNDLLDRGHQLTVITTDSQAAVHPNITELNFFKFNHHFKKFDLVELSKIDSVVLAWRMGRWKVDLLEDILSDSKVKDLLQKMESQSFT